MKLKWKIAKFVFLAISIPLLVFSPLFIFHAEETLYPFPAYANSGVRGIQPPPGIVYYNYNSYYVFFGMFLLAAGIVLIVASYYHHDETDMAVKNESITI
jgi:hypothetical protein